MFLLRIDSNMSVFYAKTKCKIIKFFLVNMFGTREHKKVSRGINVFVMIVIS